MPLLPYLLCLLFGYPSTNNASLSSDPFFKLYHRNCLKIHRLLDGAGRRTTERMKQMLAFATSNGMIGDSVALSIDRIHSPYWGKKCVRKFGKPFSTMMNRPFAGIYPAIALDLKSVLALYINQFLGRKGKN